MLSKGYGISEDISNQMNKMNQKMLNKNLKKERDHRKLVANIAIQRRNLFKFRSVILYVVAIMKFACATEVDDEKKENLINSIFSDFKEEIVERCQVYRHSALTRITKGWNGVKTLDNRASDGVSLTKGFALVA